MVLATLLKTYLSDIAEVKNNSCYNKKTGKKIAACVPMHTFGLPICIDGLVEVCNVLANQGIRVIVAGLDMDFQGKPFGPIPGLMATSEYVTKVHAV